MEAALRLSLYGVGLLGALRQSLLASMAVSLVVGVLKRPPSHPPPGASVLTLPPTDCDNRFPVTRPHRLRSRVAQKL